MRRLLRSTLIIAPAALALAACTEPLSTSPGALEGTYVLRSIDGQPIPMAQATTPTYTSILVADTIVADGRGHFTHRNVEEIDSLTVHLRTQSVVGSFQYSIKGDTVEVPFPGCPPGVFCIPLWSFGVLEAGGYLGLITDSSPSREWRYQRVR